MTEGLVRAGEGTALRKLVILADSIFHLVRLETLYDLVAPPRQLSVCYGPRLVMRLRTLQPIFAPASGSRVSSTTASVAEFSGLAPVGH
jgi:hypothetical protein